MKNNTPNKLGDLKTAWAKKIKYARGEEPPKVLRYTKDNDPNNEQPATRKYFQDSFN